MADNSDLLKRWLDKKRADVKDQTVESTDNGSLPLASNQKALYFLYRESPSNPFYNYADLYIFSGKLDTNRLIKSFEKIVQMHDVFRTRVVEEGASIYQKVIDDNSFDLIDHQATESDPKSLVRADAKLPFDLTSGPLLRVSIARDSDKTYVGVFTHHIFIDKWSMGQVREDLARIYLKLGTDPQYSPEKPKITFHQYLREKASKPNDPEGLNYWKQKINPEAHTITLPYDFERSPLPSHEGTIHDVRLSQDISKKILIASQQHDVTPFVFLLSVYYVLLKKYGNIGDINVGVPISDKLKAEYESVIGFFDETVILSNQMTDIAFSDLLQSVKSNFLEALQFRDVSLEEINRAIKPVRILGANPLFQVMFIYHPVPDLPSFGTDLEFKTEYLDLGVSKFDLTLFVGHDKEGFYLSFEYSKELFKDETVYRIADNYQKVLHEILKDIDKSIDHIDGISASERSRLLDDFSHLGTLDLPGDSVIDLIAHQVQVSPNAVAVTDHKSSLTYAELWQKSEKLGSNLQTAGIGKGALVGLLIDRSTDMISAMLGVLRSGATYLPLDPEYPDDRIKYMVNDARATLVIHNNLARKIDTLDCKVSSIEELLLEDTRPLAVSIQSEDSAYIIYTSGSTGAPKGVEVTHENLLNSTFVRTSHYPNQPNSFLLFSSFSFDSSVAGIYWTLIAGGNLVITKEKAEQDPDVIKDLIKGHQITHTLLLPPLYKVILDTIDPLDLTSLQSVSLAGEAVSKDVSNKHFALLPQCSLINEYGPTEATVWSTFHILSGNEKIVPIGKPIHNTKAYVLDESRDLVPIGVPGELYIGGKNLAKGYFGDETKTNEKFVNNPFEAGDKLYRSGDKVRWSDDGQIFFMGRADEQIKIRGFRVELSEIDAAVQSFEGVDEAATIVDSRKSSTVLSCFYSGGSIDHKLLLDFLGEKLPNHMVPGVFFRIDSVPKLPNGKIDRNALSEIEIDIHKEIQPPQGQKEEVLHEIWSDILGIQQIDRHENFFEIGGDSILSIRLISKAREKGLSISPSQIFSFPSIAQLAAKVDSDHTNQEVSKSGYVGTAILSPIQSWFFESRKPHSHFWNQAYKIRLNKPVDQELILRFLGEVLSTNDGLRQTFLEGENGVVVDYKKFEPAHFYFSLDPGPDWEKWFFEYQDQISLERGPLFRLISLSDKEEITDIVILAHHLVIDAVSWDKLLHDFSYFIQHSELRSWEGLQYKDYVEYLSSKDFMISSKNELVFWRDQVKSDEPPLVPADALSEHKGVMKVLKLEQVTVKKIQDEASRAYSLKFHELVASFFIISLMEAIDSNSVVVWFEHHGREVNKANWDLSGTIGWFTSYYPVRFERKRDLAQQILHIKDALRSIPGNGKGYGVNRYLGKESNLVQSPQFAFNYLGTRDTIKFESLQSVEYLRNVRHPQNYKSELIELNCWIEEGQLVLNLSINQELFPSVNDFADQLLKQQKAVMEHCLSATKKYSVSDFKEADISEDDLNNLLDQL